MSRIPSLRSLILCKGISCIDTNCNYQEVDRAAGSKGNTNTWYAAHLSPPLHHVSIVVEKYPRPRANIVRAMETSQRIALSNITSIFDGQCANVPLCFLARSNDTLNRLDSICPWISNVNPILPIPTRLSMRGVENGLRSTD